MATLTLLPLDLTGEALSNRIVGEMKTLGTIPNTTLRMTVFNRGAFFTDNLEVFDHISGRKLQRDVDFFPAYLYKGLTDMTTKEVMGYLVIKNPTVSSKLRINYRAIGGHFSVSVDELKALLEAVQDDNFTLTFEDIVGKPAQYNPEEHEHEFWQTYGWDTTVVEIDRVADAVKVGDAGIMGAAEEYADKILDRCQQAVQDFADAAAAHYTDYADPHDTTKTQVGLSNLNNWPMATQAEAANASVTNRYLNPAYAYRALDSIYGASLRLHLQDYNNPHQDTAEDVNAYVKSVIDSKLNGLLNRADPAANSARWGGWNFTEATDVIHYAMPPENVVSGLFNPARLGMFATGGDKLLTGGSHTFAQWRSMADIWEKYDKNANSVVVFVGYLGDNTAARNWMNANLTDLNAYPLGSYAVMRGITTWSAGGGNGGRTASYYETRVAQRTGGGWVIFT